MKIPITKPYITSEDYEYIVKPLDTGWLVQGKYVKQFENDFKSYINSDFALATTSCTTALHLALLSLNIQGDYTVVAPSYTYVATMNVIEYEKANIIFCDIDLNTFNMDINHLKSILQTHTVGCIIPVNMFGLCANLNEIIELAKQYGIPVIEDSACGLGAKIGNKHSGTFGDIGCFSFHPRKAITTGEGGMVVTNSDNIATDISILRDHGADVSDLERHDAAYGFLLPDFKIVGYNYRMTDMQGALGISQLSKSDFVLKSRKRIANKYTSNLNHLKTLHTPFIPDGYTHGYQSYVCLYTDGEDINNLDIKTIKKLGEKRNKIMQRLDKMGVATRQGGHAVHTLSYYKSKYKITNERLPMSYAADQMAISLPLYTSMTDMEINYVITAVLEVCA